MRSPGQTIDNSRRLELSRLFIWPDRVIYAGDGFSGGHAIKYSATLLVALDDRPLRVSSPGHSDLEIGACVIPPKVVRGMQTDGRFASINFDPGSDAYTLLTRRFAPNAVTPVELSELPGVDGKLRHLFETTDCKQVWDRTNATVRALCGKDAADGADIDPRVQSVMKKIRAENPVRPEVTRHARELGLSRDRLTHLFTQEAGIPLRSFVLWCKARRAMDIFGCDPLLPIDAIAQEAGFSDLSHAIRTLNRFIGVNPKYIRNLESLEICRCEGPALGATGGSR